MDTPYSNFTNAEQESDREQVCKYFPLLIRWLESVLSNYTDDAGRAPTRPRGEPR
jgi:hypothetical protein